MMMRAEPGSHLQREHLAPLKQVLPSFQAQVKAQSARGFLQLEPGQRVPRVLTAELLGSLVLQETIPDVVMLRAWVLAVYAALAQRVVLILMTPRILHLGRSP